MRGVISAVAGRSVLLTGLLGSVLLNVYLAFSPVRHRSPGPQDEVASVPTDRRSPATAGAGSTTTATGGCAERAAALQGRADALENRVRITAPPRLLFELDPPNPQLAQWLSALMDRVLPEAVPGERQVDCRGSVCAVVRRRRPSEPSDWVSRLQEELRRANAFRRISVEPARSAESGPASEGRGRVQTRVYVALIPPTGAR